jgi:hypothetical protein
MADNGGVREQAAEFRMPIDLNTTSRFRRIGGIGPAYEVMAVEGDRVRARMIDSDDEFDYPLADAEIDPKP